MEAALVFVLMTMTIGIPFVVLTWISDALEDSYKASGK